MTDASSKAPPSAPIDKDKRNWMIATCAAGGAGAAAVALGFWLARRAR